MFLGACISRVSAIQEIGYLAFSECSFPDVERQLLAVVANGTFQTVQTRGKLRPL